MYMYQTIEVTDSFTWFVSTVTVLSKVVTANAPHFIGGILINMVSCDVSNFRCNCKDGFRGNGTTCYGSILQVIFKISLEQKM